MHNRMNHEAVASESRVMLDLETFGTNVNSAVITIGAVAFTDDEINAEFYTKISRASCIEFGLLEQESTLAWWALQPEAARNEVFRDVGTSLEVALNEFATWFHSVNAREVWGNGSDFDNVLLKCAYDACNLELPWKFSNNRCYRTLKNLYPSIVMKRNGVHHNALDDARNQALHLMRILKHINQKSIFGRVINWVKGLLNK